MTTKRRHILVILCDQLRPDFLPVYGCEAVPCPSLESLAAAGTVFDRAISSCPVCAPARAGMMTGQYPDRHGVWTNDVPFADGLDYLPLRMRDLGYRTACFGKMHHFPADDPKGFEHARQMEEGRLGENEPYLRWLYEHRPDLDASKQDWRQFDHERYVFRLDDEWHYEHWMAAEAIDTIRSHAGGGAEPLFLWVSFQGPHTPYNPAPGFKGSVDAGGIPEPLKRADGEPVCPIHRYRNGSKPPPADRAELMRQRIAYAESIVQIDDEIGRILSALGDAGIREDTTILFSSDHGDLLGDYGLCEKGPFCFSGQLNVPLIVANHPAVPSGERSSVLTGNLDIPSTVLDIAGSEDGIGLSRSLIDQLPADSPVRRSIIFSDCAGSTKVAETGRYRYAYYPFTGFRELFDRTEDPWERHNLAGKPEVHDVELQMMMALQDHAVLSRGLEVGGFDLIPDVQQRLRELHPRFDRKGEFKAAFPLPHGFKQRLKEAGLDPNYTNWFRDHDVLADYGLDFEEL
jgi:arylsulfatase A-like enzyme